MWQRGLKCLYFESSYTFHRTFQHARAGGKIPRLRSPFHFVGTYTYATLRSTRDNENNLFFRSLTNLSIMSCFDSNKAKHVYSKIESTHLSF